MSFYSTNASETSTNGPSLGCKVKWNQTNCRSISLMIYTKALSWPSVAITTWWSKNLTYTRNWLLGCSQNLSSTSLVTLWNSLTRFLPSAKMGSETNLWFKCSLVNSTKVRMSFRMVSASIASVSLFRVESISLIKMVSHFFIWSQVAYLVISSSSLDLHRTWITELIKSKKSKKEKTRFLKTSKTYRKETALHQWCASTRMCGTIYASSILNRPLHSNMLLWSSERSSCTTWSVV